MPTRTSEYPQTEKPRAMTTLIVKITDGTDIRRFTANVADLTFESVQKRTAEAFGLGVKDLKLQYKDDEGVERRDARGDRPRHLDGAGRPAPQRLQDYYEQPEDDGHDDEHGRRRAAARHERPDAEDLGAAAAPR